MLDEVIPWIRDGARRGAAVTGELDSALSTSASRPRSRRGGERIWREIVRYLQRYVRAGAVLDLACGEGYFIRYVRARERWATRCPRHVGRAARRTSGSSRATGSALREVLPRRSLRHRLHEQLPRAPAVPGGRWCEQLEVVRDLLAPGGRVIVLQPNIRLVGGPLLGPPRPPRRADRGARCGRPPRVAGLVEVRTIVRFLPYTTKSRFPQHPLLVRAYLAFPPAWWLLGKQTLFIAEPPVSDTAARAGTGRPSSRSSSRSTTRARRSSRCSGR